MWFQSDYRFAEDYRRTLRDVFAVDDECRLDFSRDADGAARTINAWIGERTGGKISGAVSPESVKPPTKMVLTSALYFRANWVEGFLERLTHDATFRVSQSRSVAVRMMSQSSYSQIMGYADLGSYRVVSLPCGDGAFALVVFLPKDDDGLGTLESTLTPETLEAVWPKLTRPDDIELKMPRFRLRASLGLRPAFERLGIAVAFDRKRADFSGMNGKRNDLYLVGARHDTLIDVNERGLEAAASTAFVGADAFSVEPPVVVVDHPFFYLVRDTRSGAILFAGRVVNPVEASNP